jgi:acylphosphatase
MKRLVYLVSGTPQWEGYGDKVIKIARNIGLIGYVHNLMDGRVKVVAEGDEEKLRLFEGCVNLRNRYVFSEATGEFSDFYKLESEADEKMKKINALLKELIELWRKAICQLSNI